MLSIKQIIEIKIEKMVYGGDGFGQWKELAVFIPNVVLGDIVEARITHLKKNFARAEVIRILQKSPIRSQPKCPFFEKGCGGCQWMYIDYAEQLIIKRQIIEESLKKAGLKNVKVQSVLGMSTPYHFRNKAIAKCFVDSTKHVKVGFYEKNSHNVISVFSILNGECLAQNQMNNHTLREIAEVLSRHVNLAKNIHSIAVRSNTTQASVRLPTSIISKLPSKNQISNHIYMQIRDKKFRIFGASFFQTNTLQTNILVETVEKYLGDRQNGILVDVFSGVGLFSICFAHKFDKVIGIEASASSIKDAQFNIKQNKITNIQWIRGKAEEKFANLKDNANIVAIILDPPRQGCHKKLLEEISQSSTNKIIYVSCDLATLCRDLKILQDSNYKICEIQPIDMFPHTYHIECVVKIAK